MYNYLVSIFFICFSYQLSFAQQMLKPSAAEIAQLPEWAKMMYGSNPNVYEVQNAYEAYYRHRPFEKTYHTQYYKRWIREHQYLINDEGFILAINEADEQVKEANYLKKQSACTKTSNWEVVGPITN